MWLQSQRDAHQPRGAKRHPRGRQDPGDQRPSSWVHDGGGGTIIIIIIIIIFMIIIIITIIVIATWGANQGQSPLRITSNGFVCPRW